MGGGSNAANTAANNANAISTNSTTNAGSLYSTLTPQLESEAAAPSGFAPADLAAMDTAAEDSAGGTEAATVGQGGLLGARTRNSGAPGAAIAKGARTAGEIASKGALGTQLQNAQLKQDQHQAGLSGEENLLAGQMGESTGALGDVASNVNANTNAENASWDWTKLIPYGAGISQGEYGTNYTV